MSTTPDAPPAETNWDDIIPPNLSSITSRIAACSSSSPSSQVTLVAVSKTKPTEAVRAAHRAGQWRFGENYIQELVGKCGELKEEGFFEGR